MACAMTYVMFCQSLLIMKQGTVFSFRNNPDCELFLETGFCVYVRMSSVVRGLYECGRHANWEGQQGG